MQGVTSGAHANAVDAEPAGAARDDCTNSTAGPMASAPGGSVLTTLVLMSTVAPSGVSPELERSEMRLNDKETVVRLARFFLIQGFSPLIKRWEQVIFRFDPLWSEKNPKERDVVGTFL